MPLSVECPHCGSKYRVQDKLAGRNVKCPKCHTVIQVHAVGPDDKPPALDTGQAPHTSPTASPLAGATMPIIFACPCGKRLQVEEEWAGKRIKCPHCGRILGVPPLSTSIPSSGSPTETQPWTGGLLWASNPVTNATKRESQDGHGRKLKNGYVVVLAGLGLFAACYFLEILLGSDRRSAGCFVIPAYFIMGVAFLIGTVMVTIEKGHDFGFGLIMALISPLGLLIVTLMPERKRGIHFYTQASEGENLEGKDR